MQFILDQVFRGRSVFVTGHTGFKGSWLCMWLAKLGARVTGYALQPPTERNNFTISQVPELLAAHHVADIRDAERLTAAIRHAEPDVVFHLAAQSVVREGYREPLSTFSVNTMGTAAVLEAIRNLNRPCAAVMVTSDKCYENREQVWGYREEDHLGEHDPYGASKGAAELVIRAYRESYFPVSQLDRHRIKVASARAGNVIGGGDWTADALIVDVVTALSRGEPISIRRPKALRPWQHVLQALSGYLTLAAQLLERDDPALCSAWNIGPFPGNEIPVQEVVALFIEQWGSGNWIDRSDPASPREANILRLCIDKALWQLSWKPCWSIQQVLRHTADWYREYFSGANMQGCSFQQIATYEAAMRESLGSGPSLSPHASSCSSDIRPSGAMHHAS